LRPEEREEEKEERGKKKRRGRKREVNILGFHLYSLA